MRSEVFANRPNKRLTDDTLRGDRLGDNFLKHGSADLTSGCHLMALTCHIRCVDLE